MQKLTPMRAIRAKCLDCCCGSAYEVRMCDIKTCPLYPYKAGRKPKEGTEEYKLITEGSLTLNLWATGTLEEKERELKGGEES